MGSDLPGGASGQPSVGRSDLARKILIGCGVVALLAVAAIVAFVLYVKSNPASVTDLMMKQIESHYASDVTEGQKQDLRAAYADFRAALARHRVDRNAMQKIQMTFSSSSSREMTAEQVRALTAAFREAAGVEATPRSTPSAMTPGTSPTQVP
jgi:flagellar basal body-associated protein FliL